MRTSIGTIGACASACALALATAANAADEEGKSYVNPIFGYTWLDSSRAVDDGEHYGVGFGHHFSEHWSAEINGLRGEFEGGTARELQQSAYSVDALRVFSRASRVSPYVTFGLGWIENEFNVITNQNGELVQGGAGLLVDLGENRAKTFVFQLRPEIKYRYDFADGPTSSNNSDYLFNLGFAMNFGGRRPAVSEQASAPPPPPPPAARPPSDSDGDGVLDPNDRCPGTPRGVAVDNTGCPRAGSVTLRGVEFDFDRATLTAASRPILDGVAADLKQHPRLRVELQGHTDSRGADAYNLGLSQRRAETVRDYLVSQGVPAGQLVAKGYGETRPVANNSADAGRADNRRVDMAVLDNPGNVEVEGATPIR